MATMVGTIGTAPREAGLAHPHATLAAGAKESVAKNVALFFAAPFIGLAYIIAFPFVGAAAVVKAAARSRA